MDRDWLAERLARGDSIAKIAAEAGKGHSTVAYWINKHGLAAANAVRHAAKGPIDEAHLRALVEEGKSIREIAAELDRGAATVRHWMKRYGLTTQPLRYRRGPDKPPTVMRECPTHGWTTYAAEGPRRHYRCGACAAHRVTTRRRRVKAQLVAEAGGRCVLCGYDHCIWALQFHHVDPATKRFALSGGGLTRGIDELRAEAARCVLLCGNCHAEVEAGVTALPFGPSTRSS